MANEKKLYNLNVAMNGEIRKIEEVKSTFTNKKGEEIESTKWILYVDDEQENRLYLTERDQARAQSYKKGTTGTFKLRIACEEEFGIKARITILDFIPLTA